MTGILLKRKFLSFKNKILNFSKWQIIKNLIFLSIGILILICLYMGFWRLLNYLEHIQLIGAMLSWKLTSMVLLITFAMIVVSSVIISMTTLYYSSDLKFLFSVPVSSRVLFSDKALETVFYSSWTLMLAILPYIAALAYVKNLGAGFYLCYASLIIPFIMIAASFGMIFSMLVMYVFPTSRTRDIAWILGSLSVGFVYVMFRFSRPEKLLRPDALEVVAQYINYLQSPTAGYLPSWWLTKAMISYSNSDWGAFALNASYLFLAAFAIYFFMVWLSKFIYSKGFSGAQTGIKFKGSRKNSFEQELVEKKYPYSGVLTLAWKDRKLFLRDARYWTQIVLIVSLILVYLFSIRQLPLGGPGIKSLVSFLNVGVAGFVISAIGLRFIFPLISLEGNNFWILKSSPVNCKTVMAAKLLISCVPTVLIGIVLVLFSNKFLRADTFVSILSLVTITVSAIVISFMGTGIGALFPDFKVENIHQIESSFGGFIYMACAMGYMALTIGFEAWPVRMHFAQFFGKQDAWDFKIVGFCFAGLLALNILAVVVSWKLGLKNLKNLEI